MFANLHVLHTNIEFNIQYTRYLINSVLQNGLGSITLPTIYHPILDKLLANSNSPTIRWSVSNDATSDPCDLLEYFNKYQNISFVVEPQKDFRLERLQKCFNEIRLTQTAFIYINCVDISAKELGQYLDSVCLNPNIFPIVLLNENLTDSILYCKSAQKYCAVKFGLAHDWTFDGIEMAKKCEINLLMSTDTNIVHLLHK